MKGLTYALLRLRFIVRRWHILYRIDFKPYQTGQTTQQRVTSQSIYIFATTGEAGLV